MEKIELTVNIPLKTLAVDGKPISLENTFTDAYIDHEDTKEPVLNLKYEKMSSEDYSLIELEMDKLGEAYGEKISERINISGSILDNVSYISFYGNINPIIES